MTRDDIAEIIAAYRAAALRVREGGLDGVELLAAFGFLIAAFLSPLEDLRTSAFASPWRWSRPYERPSAPSKFWACGFPERKGSPAA
jgi:hypothetical protein